MVPEQILQEQLLEPSDNDFCCQMVGSIIASEFKRRTKLPYQDGFYRFPTSFVPISYSLFYFYLLLTSFISGIAVIAFSYKWISLKITKHKYMPVDDESKQD